jgi:hypothetical protein
MPKARRQHFVPRFYLKNFGDQKIFCYDKSNDNVVESNANDIALGKNFYELEGLRGGEIEKFLSHNESKFSKAYYEIRNKKDISKLSDDSSNHLFLFIASQLVRTMDLLLELENVSSKVHDKIHSKPTNKSLKEKGSELAGRVRASRDPEVAKAMQTQMIVEQVPEFAAILANKKWIIEKNHQDTPLWTSDNPVALHNRMNLGPSIGNLGLNFPGIEIHFPLTSNLLLLSFDPRTHRLTRNRKGVLDYSNVIFENIQIQLMRSSFRFIYASSDNDFDRARKFLLEKPEFRSRRQTRRSLLN